MTKIPNFFGTQRTPNEVKDFVNFFDLLRIYQETSFLLTASGMTLINAMKNALGDIMDPVSLQAMEVSAVMAQAGASKVISFNFLPCSKIRNSNFIFFQEEIEEMMALLLSQGPGVSADFIDAVKDCIIMGGKCV